MNLGKLEARISKHVPFAYLEQDDLIRTKNGDFLAILKIEGLSWETLEDDELNFQQTLRAQLFSALADSRLAVYHTVIRSQAKTTLTGNYQSSIAQKINQAYQQTLIEKPVFSNDLYLALIFKCNGSQDNRIQSRLKKIFSQLSHQLIQEQEENSRQEAIKTLNEVTLRFLTALEKYKIRKLQTLTQSSGIFSEQLKFLGNLLNWENQNMLAIEGEISQYLAKRQLFFGDRVIESEGNLNQDSRFSAILSLKEYPNHTFPGMLDYLLQLPVELIVTQSFTPQHRLKSREDLELQLRRLRQAKDPDQKGIQQLQQALGGVVSSEFSFGYHHLTVMILADNLEQLEKNIALADKRLSECGIIAVRERLNLEAAFWAQLPGNFHYIVRKTPITSDNFASLCSLNNDPPGNANGNHWGPALALLKTPNNLPYYFNFHAKDSDVGHSLILGMTGSGKTLLTCFLIASAMKYPARIFYFDKDHGAEVFMRSLGADYISLGNGSCAGLNPLQLPPTPENRSFLVAWLSSLLTASGNSLSTEDMEIIHNAVKLNYDNLAPEERTLKNLAAAFGRTGPGTLRNRIDQWHSDQALSEFFGSEQDTLQLDNPHYCFEMGQLLQKANQTALPSVLLYLFHRIELALSAAGNVPTIICLDEAWSLLNNPIFAENIKNWLKTFRKRNAIVIMLSQEVSDISQASVSESINGETITKIFLPNPTPNKEIYKNFFHLSEREINLLKEYSAGKRYFLVKQPQESLFVSLDLTGMQEWIPLLSNNSQNIQLMRRLIEEKGKDPEAWVNSYLQQTAHEHSKNK